MKTNSGIASNLKLYDADVMSLYYAFLLFVFHNKIIIPSIHTNFNWNNIYFLVVLYHLFQNNNV